MQIRLWLRAAIARLTDSESARRDAEILLAMVIGKSRSWLIAFDDSELSPAQLERLDELVTRRAAGVPIAYLTGEREFWSLPIDVSPDTLIPRPDTEVLVELALARLPADVCRVLDLGTGTGAIALAVASERPTCEITGVDRIPGAVDLARHNAKKLGLTNVSFEQSNWFSSLNDQRFTMIISNPPYIDAADAHLNEGDVRFEPASALVAAGGGLADIRHIAANAGQHLLPEGWLLLEHGWQQGADVRQILRDNDFCAVETRQDYGGNDRVTLGKRAV